MVNIPLYNCDLSSILFAADCTFVPNCIQNTIHSRKPRKLRVFSEETGLNLVASCKKLTKELGRKQYLHPRKRTNMTMGKKKQSFEDVSSIKNGVLFHSRWFKVTFWSPSWRSLNLWRGHLTIPKRSQRIARLSFVRFLGVSALPNCPWHKPRGPVREFRWLRCRQPRRGSHGDGNGTDPGGFCWKNPEFC